MKKDEKVFIITVLCIILAILIAGQMACTTPRTIRCKSTSFKEVTIIGLNGQITTTWVPFCDTVQILPKLKDSLKQN